MNWNYGSDIDDGYVGSNVALSIFVIATFCDGLPTVRIPPSSDGFAQEVVSFDDTSVSYMLMATVQGDVGAAVTVTTASMNSEYAQVNLAMAGHQYCPAGCTSCPYPCSDKWHNTLTLNYILFPYGTTPSPTVTSLPSDSPTLTSPSSEPSSEPTLVPTFVEQMGKTEADTLAPTPFPTILKCGAHEWTEVETADVSTPLKFRQYVAGGNTDCWR